MSKRPGTLLQDHLDRKLIVYTGKKEQPFPDKIICHLVDDNWGVILGEGGMPKLLLRTATEVNTWKLIGFVD